MIRCDQCDNGMIARWLFCPYCGHPQTDEGIEAAQRELTARQQAQAEIYRLSKKAEQIVYDERGWAVANATVYHGYGDRDECRANARLIAAAPDLVREIASFLKAYDLIRAGNIADVAFVVQVHLPKFRAALAAATGAKVPA